VSERERERENEREKAEGLGSREVEKRELLDRDGDDRRVGLSCRRSHRMEWAPFSLLPLGRVTSPTDSLVHVESLCMHVRCAQFR